LRSYDSENKHSQSDGKVIIDKKSIEFAFWQAQSYQFRLETLEEIRREYIQWKYHAEPGLQRVSSMIKQK
jgi:hypothetical protein